MSTVEELREAYYFKTIKEIEEDYSRQIQELESDMGRRGMFSSGPHLSGRLKIERKYVEAYAEAWLDAEERAGSVGDGKAIERVLQRTSQAFESRKASFNQLRRKINAGSEEYWERTWQELWTDQCSMIERELMIRIQESNERSYAQPVATLPTHLQDMWNKAIERLAQGDYSGSVTAARSLMESVAKYVLDCRKAHYELNAELPSLLRVLKNTLWPNAQQDRGAQAESLLVSGLTNLVHGMAPLRNEVGDAHGQGTSHRPALVHQARAAVYSALAFSELVWGVHHHK